MKWSKSHIVTRRDIASDVELVSDGLLQKAGFIKKVAPGIYTYQNIALRVLNKISNIVREELEMAGCVEILMPVVQPKSLWNETGRWDFMGKSLLKFKNRNDQDFCLGPTHEEVVTDLVRSDIKSYRDLPKNIYHIQTKYRDEIRPRFGLMRCREFLMKDAYSFDADKDKAQVSYQKMYKAYSNIFMKVGLSFRVVEADTGDIGGNQSHEFHAVAGAGEDAILLCKSHAYNLEIAPVGKVVKDTRSDLLEISSFDTPNIRTIAKLSNFLNVPESELVKSMFFYDGGDNPILVLVRGSDEVNPLKLEKVLDSKVKFMTDQEVEDLTGSIPGSCGPVGLENVKIYLDHGICNMTNFVTGGNQDGMHLKNVNYKRDFNIEGFFDLVFAKEGDVCPLCDGEYEQHRGVEVGHIFYLGTKYSKSMNATFLDAQQQSKFFEMGCYGIGVSRTMQAIIEQSHDDKGIIWPISVAPYQVHICNLDVADSSVTKFVNRIYSELSDFDIEVLVDDRDERPGVKFNDADLLGIPCRVTVGKRSFDKGQVELVDRKTLKKDSVSVNDIVSKIKDIVLKV